ncbi:MAG: hypothetical protein H7Y42_05360 [Chitinophagaceae bacterium]|nr:hypothetical protein [Chitinophagaceae bacterium]
MKVAHSHKNVATAEQNWLDAGRHHEREGELAEAAQAYEKWIRSNPLDEKVYNRLMMLYRQLKEYKKEYAIIESGIKAFETSYTKHKPKGKKIENLSNALLLATGLTDKKGNSLYHPGPLDRWKKRILVVEKKMR